MVLNFFTRHLYVLAVGGAVLGFAAAQISGWPADAVVLVWSVVTLATGVMLERAAPFDPRWSRSHGDIRVDSASAVVAIGMVDPLVKPVLPLLAVSMLATTRIQSSWPLGSLPLAVQIGAALLWIEFAKYWSHRLHHVWPRLWWLHALHHSSKRLYWLNNFRFHPLNQLTNTFVSLFPLLVLGAPKNVLLGALAVTQPVLMLQHLNVRTSNGWLNRVFSTNEVHRWHHSGNPAEANANYGSALVLWDHVFGTFKNASTDSRPTAVGLFGSSGGYPADAPYVEQVLSLWTASCCRA